MNQYIRGTPARSGLYADGAACLLLAALALLAFRPITGNGFIAHYDDGVYLVANPEVASGLTLRGVRWAFTTFHAANWHPVTWLSHMVDVSLFGWDPGGHHAMGLAIHIANGLLLYGLFRRMTGSVARSGFVAGLFLVHPLHVESVAWAAERKDLLCAFFAFLAIHAYVSWVRRPSSVRYWVVALLYGVALMSKPMVVTLPFVLLLLDFWPLRRFEPEVAGGPERPAFSRLAVLAREKSLLFLMAAASCTVTWFAQQEGGAVLPAGMIPFWYRALNALVSYGKYLWMTVAPSGLCVFYPHPGNSGVPLSLTWAAGSALFLAISGGLAFRMRRVSPWLLFGWCWYVGTLVPVIGLVQVGGQAMADRYTYIPLIGPFVAVAWEAAVRLSGRPGILRHAAVATCGAILIVLAVLARDQVLLWKDSLSLFGRALEVSRNNWNAHNIIGVELGRRGDLEGAERHLRESVRINPGADFSRYNLAYVLHRQGRNPEASVHLVAALQIRPDNPEALELMERIAGRRETLGQQIEYLEGLVRRRPGDPDGWNDLGTALSEGGRRPEAIARYREAIRLDPLHSAAHFNLAVDLEAEGDLREAARHYREVLRLHPGDAEAAGRLKAIADR